MSDVTKIEDAKKKAEEKKKQVEPVLVTIDITNDVDAFAKGFKKYALCEKCMKVLITSFIEEKKQLMQQMTQTVINQVTHGAPPPPRK